jgi:hypothetical protein
LTVVGLVVGKPSALSRRFIARLLAFPSQVQSYPVLSQM